MPAGHSPVGGELLHAERLGQMLQGEATRRLRPCLALAARMGEIVQVALKLEEPGEQRRLLGESVLDPLPAQLLEKAEADASSASNSARSQTPPDGGSSARRGAARGRGARS